LFEGLTEYDPVTLEPVPGVAERWETNDTATRFTFYLRADARWSNGRAVTAQDFVNSWRRALDPATASPNAYLLYRIKNAEAYNTGKQGTRKEDVGVRAIDEFTLEVETDSPTAYFVKLTMCGVFRPVPLEVAEQAGKQWTSPGRIVTNGPFALKEWQLGARIVLERSRSYWDARSVRLERAVFYLAEDANTFLNLYKAGELDTMTSGLLPPYALRVLKDKRDYQSGPYLLSYFLLVNTSRPPLSDRRVREALSLALDRDQICNRVLRAGQKPLTALTPSDFGGLYPRPAGRSFDLSLARTLMAEAGYPDGRRLRFRYVYNAGALHSQVAEAIQAGWREAFPYIAVELVNQNWPVFLDAVRLRDFDIARRSWTADYSDPASFLDMMLSTNANNPTGWANADYDRLITQANTEPNQTVRMQLLAQAEEVLLRDVPIIPIYSSAVSLMTKPYVHGWAANVLDRHPLKFVSVEKPSTD
jgi:ABC-type oligopeptide transport system substrate-binding subunit